MRDRVTLYCCGHPFHTTRRRAYTWATALAVTSLTTLVVSAHFLPYKEYGLSCTTVNYTIPRCFTTHSARVTAMNVSLSPVQECFEDSVPYACPTYVLKLTAWDPVNQTEVVADATNDQIFYPFYFANASGWSERDRLEAETHIRGLIPVGSTWAASFALVREWPLFHPTWKAYLQDPYIVLDARSVRFLVVSLAIVTAALLGMWSLVIWFHACCIVRPDLDSNEPLLIQ